MKSIEERLIEYGRSSLVRPDESKIEETVRSAKQGFYESAGQREPYYIEFIYEQTRYIKKKWWLWQFLILFLTGCVIHEVNSVMLVQRLMGISASLFVIMMIPELWKSHSSHSLEIEGASYFSLRKLYAARMLIFAAVDSIFLGIFTEIISLTVMVSMEEMLIQFFLPMTVTCCICFRTLCSRYAASEYMACFLSLLWSAIWILLILDDNIYQAVSVPVWLGICCAAILYLTYIVKRMLCGRDDEWEAYYLHSWQ